MFGAARTNGCGPRRPGFGSISSTMHVVNGRAVARADFNRLRPLVFREVGRHLEVLVDRPCRAAGTGSPRASTRPCRAAPMLPAVGDRQAVRACPAGSPSGAPALAHFTIVSLIRRSLRRRSFEELTMGGSACHGGIVPLRQPGSAIAFAQGLRLGRTTVSGIGPISPGRWHPAQSVTRIGATSLLNVGVGDCAYTDEAAPMRLARAMATRVQVIGSSD